MEKYKIHSVNYDSNTFYCVYELATEQVYDYFIFEDDAINCKKFLDRGGSFDGFTPSFMLKKVVVATDINTQFSEL
jgi:hypothetical protein